MKSSGVRVTFSIGQSDIVAKATLIGQGQTFSVEGTGTFTYADNSIVFEPRQIKGEGVSDQVAMNALKVVRPMPSIGGVRPTSVETAPGELILRAEVDRFTFEPVEQETLPRSHSRRLSRPFRRRPPRRGVLLQRRRRPRPPRSRPRRQSHLLSHLPRPRRTDLVSTCVLRLAACRDWPSSGVRDRGAFWSSCSLIPPVG